MAEFMTFNQKALQMRLQESMADSMERMASRQSQGNLQSQSQPSLPPPPSYWPPSQQYQWPSFPYPSTPNQTIPAILPPPPPPPSLPSQPQSQSTQPPQLTRPPSYHEAPPALPTTRSSPIGTAEEEEDIIEQFFLWKARSKKPAMQERIRTVANIIMEQMWTVDDMKLMSDSSSSTYSRAMQLGIPDGMARSFRTDLRIFKPQWREANMLATMRDGRNGENVS
jgi:hypothetical protein